MEYDYEQHIDNLVDIVNDIDINEITILTGSNASGKSLVRRLLQPTLTKKLGRKIIIPHSSMQLRTEVNSSMGALSSASHDLSWLATSDSTIGMIKRVLAHEGDYHVIDEPELGVGEELQLGLIDFINDKIKQFKLENKGILIITHSRLIVSKLNHDVFINIDGMNYDEWLNRIAIKRSLEEFEVSSRELFKCIRNRMSMK